MYNDERSRLGTVFLKLQLSEERSSRSLQDKGSQAGAWEPANARNLIGWALVVGAVSAMIIGVLSGLRFTLHDMTLFDLLTILVLSIGGLGLFLSSLRPTSQ